MDVIMDKLQKLADEINYDIDKINQDLKNIDKLDSIIKELNNE